MKHDNRKLTVKPEYIPITPYVASPEDYAGASSSVEQVDIRRVWDVFRRRWLLMFCVLGVVLACGAFYTVRQKPVYQSTAMMIVAITPSTASRDDVELVSDISALTKMRSVQSTIEVMNTPEVISGAVQELGEEQVIKGFGTKWVPGWAVSIDSKKDSDVISITAKAYDPQVAADLANALVTTYMERDQGFANQAIKQGREFVSSELNMVQKQLSQAQKELADYKRKTKLVVGESQLQTIAGNALAMQAEQDKADIELEATRRQTEALKAQLAAEGQEIEAGSTVQMSPEYQAALARLGELNSKRAQMIQEYTPESKEIKKLDAEIAATEQRMKQVAQTVVTGKTRTRNPAMASYLNSMVDGAAASARSRILRRVVASRNRQLDSLPEQERTMAKLMQKVNVLQNTYQMLSQKNYTLLINEKSTSPSARFVSTARSSPVPFVSNKRKNAALFFLVGFMLSVMAAVIAERMDNKVRDEHEVSQLLGEAPLSIIPDLKGLGTPSLQIDAVDPNSPFVESFRILRNVIQYMSRDNKLKKIAITSPGRAEGKSTTSINLAVSMAMSGKKVLIVDCDLRRPSVHKYADTSRSVGFTNLVKGLISIEDAVLPTRVENLYCIPSGPFPPSPADFLNSNETRQMIDDLAERYDVVIIDCPPCAGLSDMQVVATMADGVVLVVSVDRTMRTSLRHTLQTLSQVDAPVVGYVVNRMDIKRSGYDYYYYSPEDEEDSKDKRNLLRLPWKKNGRTA